MALPNFNKLDYSSIVTPVYLLGVSSEGHGLVIRGNLAADYPGGEGFLPLGNVAASMELSFRIVKRAFCHSFPECALLLKQLNYVFECDIPGIKVREDRSASLALAIGLINILRSIGGLPQLVGVAASGIVCIDGSILEIDNFEAKKNAALHTGFIHHIISPVDAAHLTDFVDSNLNLKSGKSPFGNNKFA